MRLYGDIRHVFRLGFDGGLHFDQVPLEAALPKDRHLVLCGHDHPVTYQYDTVRQTRYGKGPAACAPVRCGKKREISYCVYEVGPRGPIGNPEEVKVCAD